jgi:hypothetical protein
MTEQPGIETQPYEQGGFLWSRLCWLDYPTHYPDHPSQAVTQPCGLCGATGEPVAPSRPITSEAEA